jgi:hypothetical protein
MAFSFERRCNVYVRKRGIDALGKGVGRKKGGKEGGERGGKEGGGKRCRRPVISGALIGKMKNLNGRGRGRGGTRRTPNAPGISPSTIFITKH